MRSKLKVNMVSESTFTVQGHGVHTAFLEMTHVLARRPDIDVIINKFRRGADITHIHTFGPYSLLHLLFGPGKKVVSVHVVPDSLIGSIIGAKQLYNIARRYMKFFYNKADLLLAVSGMVESTLRSQLGVTKPVAVLYNTIDTKMYATTPADKLAARKALDIPVDAHVIITSAQIQPRKRFDIFCKIAAELPNSHFIWIGGMPFKQFGADYKIMQQLRDDCPPNVCVTGVIDHPNVKQYLQVADVFFLPSDQENHPMSVIEAAATGLPIVVRDIPEYDDTFKKDVIRGHDDTFATIIERLFTDAAFKKTATKGAASIAKRFDSQASGEQLVTIYKTLL